MHWVQKKNIFQRARTIKKRRSFFFFFLNALFFLVHFCLCLAGGYRRQPESFVLNDKVTIRRSSQEPDSIRPSWSRAATTRWPLKRTNGLDFMHGDNFIMIYRLSLEKLALEWTRFLLSLRRDKTASCITATSH